MKDPIFNVSEIMWHILGFAEFRSIVVIGHTNQKGRLYMQFALAALISTMVKAYLPTAYQRKFFSVLGSANGAITGSSTLQVLLSYERRFIQAHDLNIIVPNKKLTLMLSFLQQRGYQSLLLETKRCLLEVVSSCWQLTHVETKRVILLTESTKPTVLNVVFKGKNTSSMNLITAKSIYSFYHNLISTNLAYSGFIPIDELDIRSSARWGIELRDPMLFLEDEQTAPCGVECPKVVRRMRNLFGVNAVCWNTEGEEMPLLSEERMTWYLGPYCRNKYCKYSNYPFSQ